MYIAKDKDEEVWLYERCPLLIGSTFTQKSGKCLSVNITNENLKALFGIDNLTFENSPIEIEVKIKQ